MCRPTHDKKRHKSNPVPKTIIAGFEAVGREDGIRGIGIIKRSQTCITRAQNLSDCQLITLMVKSFLRVDF